MARIERLEKELTDLHERYGSAAQSVRQLALALEEALTEVDLLRQKPATAAVERVVSIDRVKK